MTDSTTGPSVVPCEECGFPAAGGAAGCQAIFDRMLAASFERRVPQPVHRLMVDAYSVQHPDRYCRSAKSLAAHLGGLCCFFEFGAEPAVGRALLRWLNRPRAIVKPGLPDTRGVLTLAEVIEGSDPGAFRLAIERWARAAWQAHAALHPVARGWIAEALDAPPDASPPADA
ncbi:MAG: hypothetical protein HYR73_07605 [Candidatus Eisenbacteria bacterium]|nr:hypothetical protein [Candidatus Eisenbacteria bacterium]